MSQLFTLHHVLSPQARPTLHLRTRTAASPRRPRFIRRPTPLCDVLAGQISESLRTALQSATGSQLGIGSVLGFATGYAAKRIGQLLLVIAGVQVVAVQLMARRGWLVVDWDRVGKDLAPRVRSDRVDWMLDLVKYRVPFAGAFTAGCFAGFRWS